MSEVTSEQAIRVNVTVWLSAGARCDPQAPDATGQLEAPAQGAACRRPVLEAAVVPIAAGIVRTPRRLEALRWAEEVERWRQLVRWTTAQCDAA